MGNTYQQISGAVSGKPSTYSTPVTTKTAEGYIEWSRIIPFYSAAYEFRGARKRKWKLYKLAERDNSYAWTYAQKMHGAQKPPRETEDYWVVQDARDGKYLVRHIKITDHQRDFFDDWCCFIDARKPWLERGAFETFSLEKVIVCGKKCFDGEFVRCPK